MAAESTYPLEIRNVGDDTYIVMSKGHHDPHAFMAAVREAGYNWPLGQPSHQWVKTTPCPPSCGEHTCHYTMADEKRRGWFPATYAWETDAANLYKPPPIAGVQSGSPTSQLVTPTTVLSACPGNGPSCPNACSCAAYAGKCEPALGVKGNDDAQR